MRANVDAFSVLLETIPDYLMHNNVRIRIVQPPLSLSQAIKKFNINMHAVRYVLNFT